MPERMARLEEKVDQSTVDIADIKEILREHTQSDLESYGAINTKLDKIDLQTAFAAGKADQRKQIFRSAWQFVLAAVGGGALYKVFVWAGLTK